MINIKDKQFSVTGDFKHLGENLTRKNIVSVLENLGGTFNKGAKSSDVWLVGDGAGNKKSKISEIAIIIDSPFEIKDFQKKYMSYVGIKQVTTTKETQPQNFIPEESKYLIIDIETTGFSPKTCNIIEIGAILVNREFDIINTFETFVYSDNIPYQIEKLTGITVEDTIDAPTINEVLKDLSNFAKDATMIAHYSPFDQRFIRHFLEKTNTKFIETPWIDSINIFKKKFIGMPNYKLATLISHFKLADKEDHRALSDAKHTLTLLKMAIKENV